MLKVKVYDSTIRKRLDKYGLFGLQEIVSSLEKEHGNMTQVCKSSAFSNNTRHTAQLDINTQLSMPQLLPWELRSQTPHTGRQHGGGGMMVWACFANTEPGHLAVNESP